MKKTALFLLAAGALVFTTLPVNAQKKSTPEPIKKETTQGRTAKTVANPADPAKGTKSAPASAPAQASIPLANPPAPPSQAAPPAPPVPLTCTWDMTDYDFAKNVIQGKPASATFTITNAGKDPVTITMVQPSCGCTSPKYTKEPIKPGDKGEVVLTYDAKNPGYFSKSATVKLNDGQKYSLTFKGEVQKAEPAPAPTPAVVK